MATRVYRDCIATIWDRNITTDLIKLAMGDFDVIIQIDWLYSCFAKFNCWTRTATFEFPMSQSLSWSPQGCEDDQQGMYLPFGLSHRRCCWGTDTSVLLGCEWISIGLSWWSSQSATRQGDWFWDRCISRHATYINLHIWNDSGRIEGTEEVVERLTREGFHLTECFLGAHQFFFLGRNMGH